MNSKWFELLYLYILIAVVFGLLVITVGIPAIQELFTVINELKATLKGVAV